MKDEKKIIDYIKKQKMILLPFLALGIISFFVFLKNTKTNPAPGVDGQLEQHEPESVDTYIPKGYVLVPLDLINIESIGPFVGDKGVVDLYLTANGQKSKKVAERIKIIRAPLNPDVYAALVSEKNSRSLMVSDNPYFAVVQNESETKSEFAEKPAAKSSYTIIYDQGQTR